MFDYFDNFNEDISITTVYFLTYRLSFNRSSVVRVLPNFNNKQTFPWLVNCVLLQFPRCNRILKKIGKIPLRSNCQRLNFVSLQKVPLSTVPGRELKSLSRPVVTASRIESERRTTRWNLLIEYTGSYGNYSQKNKERLHASCQLKKKKRPDDRFDLLESGSRQCLR